MTQSTPAWTPRAVVLAEHYEDSGGAPDLSALAAAVPAGAILAAVAIPNDDVVLLVVDADHVAEVAAAAIRAGVPFDRTVPAVLHVPPTERVGLTESLAEPFPEAAAG